MNLIKMKLRLIFINFFVCEIFSARILIIPMHWGASHTKTMLPLAETLAAKNHEVFIWTPLFNGSKPHAESKTVKFLHTMVDTDDRYTLDALKFNNFSASEEFWTRTVNDPPGIIWPWHYDQMFCDLALQQGWNSSIKEILEEHWDLMLTGVAYAPCVYVFVELTRSERNK